MRNEDLRVETCEVQPLNSSKEIPLPAFDEARGTRKICVAGLVFSWLLSLLGLLLAIEGLTPSTIGLSRIVSFTLPEESYEGFSEGIILAVNIIITVCIDCNGYIHAASLRWQLYQEGRLHFNSYLRLFTGTRKKGPNSALANVLSACCHVMCYTGASQMLALYSGLNPMSLLFISMGMAGQASLSTWCLCVSNGIIRSWSSNPLNTTLVCLHNGMQHHRGRCMVSVWPDQDGSPDPKVPATQQPTARSVYTDIRHITRLLWCLTTLVVCWAIAILVVRIRGTPAWDSVTIEWAVQDAGFDMMGGLRDSANLKNFLSLLFISGVQALLTLGLHCAELIVNVTRDEQMWRSAAKFCRQQKGISSNEGKGVSFASNSIKAAATSWQSVALFLTKPIAHWCFGLGMKYTYYQEGMSIFAFSCLPLFALTGCAIIVSVCAIMLVRRAPRGPQPAAWGHLQTLANLIDDWGKREQDRLFWGDKGVYMDRIRHAGTSRSSGQVGVIRMGSLYA